MPLVISVVLNPSVLPALWMLEKFADHSHSDAERRKIRKMFSKTLYMLLSAVTSVAYRLSNCTCP